MKYERTKALKMIPQIDYKVAIKTSFKLLLFQIYKKMKILQFVSDYKDSCYRHHKFVKNDQFK